MSSIKKVFVMLVLLICCLSTGFAQPQSKTTDKVQLKVTNVNISKNFVLTPRINPRGSEFSINAIQPSRLVWGYTIGETGFDDEPSAFVNTEDGGYLVYGYTKSFGLTKSSIYLLKVDINGIPQWEKIYSAEGVQFLTYSAQQTTDLGYVLTGTMFWSDGITRNYLLKINSLGEIEWLQYFNGTAYCLSDVKQYLDGGYFIVTSEQYNGGYGVLFIRTDEFGNILWEQRFRNQTEEFGAEILIERTTGNIIVTSSTSTSDYNIYRFSNTGNLLAMKTISRSIDKITNIGKIIQTSDNGFILCGVNITYSGSLVFYDVSLLRLNNSFGTVWKRDYYVQNIEHAQANWVAETNSGEFVMVGSIVFSEASGSNQDLFLINTTSSGSLLWMQQYDFSKADKSYYVHYTSDGGFVIGGKISEGTGTFPYDILLMKLR